jgi:hypothetical protein
MTIKKMTNEELVPSFAEEPYLEELETEILSRLDLGQQAIEAMEKVIPIIKAIIDEDNCWYDHHGQCQAHSCDLDDGTCAQEALKRFTKDWEAGK